MNPAAARMVAQTRTGADEPDRVASFSVFLFRNESVLAIGEAREVGPDGMVVMPLPRFADPLPRGCSLELGFGVEQGAITRRYRIPVRVVCQDARGVGLAFDADDAALVATVTRALVDRPPEEA